MLRASPPDAEQLRRVSFINQRRRPTSCALNHVAESAVVVVSALCRLAISPFRSTLATTRVLRWLGPTAGLSCGDRIISGGVFSWSMPVEGHGFANPARIDALSRRRLIPSHQYVFVHGAFAR
jgi:hypothetical protein